jgi:hypothetical protein
MVSDVDKRRDQVGGLDQHDGAEGEFSPLIGG